LGAGNVELTKEELDELNQFTESMEAKGDGYKEAQEKYLSA